MNQMLTRLVVLVALGCKSSTGPAGFTLHAEVVNKTTFPNYWANTPFSWQYLNAQDIILAHGTITIQSDSACLTPPVAPPTTTRRLFSVLNCPHSFASPHPDMPDTLTPANFGPTF